MPRKARVEFPGASIICSTAATAKRRFFLKTGIERSRDFSNVSVGAYTEPEIPINWSSFTGFWLAARISGTSPYKGFQPEFSESFSKLLDFSWSLVSFRASGREIRKPPSPPQRGYAAWLGCCGSAAPKSWLTLSWSKRLGVPSGLI